MNLIAKLCRKSRLSIYDLAGNFRKLHVITRIF